MPFPISRPRTYILRAARELAKGTGLQTFLRAYESGLRGLALYNFTRTIKGIQGQPQNVQGQVYQIYKGMAEGGEKYNSLPSESRPFEGELQTNPYLNRLDQVQDKFQYWVDVEAQIEGEESIYRRTIRVTSPHELSFLELVDHIPNDLGGSLFDQFGRPVEPEGTDLVVLSASVVAVAKLY